MTEREKLEIEIVNLLAQELAYLCGTDVVNHPLGFDIKRMRMIANIVADHVIKREIEALKSIPSGLFDSTPYINERIAELERQLKENK